MTMRFRTVCGLLAGLVFACASWAQEAVQADTEAWGVYATLAGQERQQAGATDTYLMRWHWVVPGVRLREEYRVPSSGTLAHYNEITLGTQPRTLHLKASYMGGKEWNGTLDASGTVHWVGKGLFKLRYSVGPGPDDALVYGAEGPNPVFFVRTDGGAAAATKTTATPKTTAANAPADAQATSVAAPGAGAASTAVQHAAQAAALEAQARELRAMEAAAATQRQAAEAAGQAKLAALQAEVQVKAALAAEEIEAQARAQAQLAGSADTAVAPIPAATTGAQPDADPAQPSATGVAAQPDAAQRADAPSRAATDGAPADAIPPAGVAKQSIAPAPAAAPAPSAGAQAVATNAPTPAPAPASTPAPPPASPTEGFTAGTYRLDGGSYVIEVQRDGDGLLVVEPNKRSPYAWKHGRDFHFYNPNTDTTYGIRIVDARTIEAFKPFASGSTPSRLVLISAAAGAAQENLGDPAFEAIAQKYATLAAEDGSNVQAWTACAAAALKYSMATREDADAHARQVIGMLRLMDAQSTPCEDALPSRLW